MRHAPAGLAWLGLVGASLLISIGTYHAFETGAPDFSVFFHAWELVLRGDWVRIYFDSPDRFLYAPGFAWLLAPLALLPKSFAIAGWCFAKAAVLGYLMRELGARLFRSESPVEAAGLAAWGAILYAKPILIDLQYGQVNFLILGASTWALLRHFGGGSGRIGNFLSWAVLATAALSKLYALPLLVVPWVATAGIDRHKIRTERAGVVFGLGLVALIPVLGGGWASLQVQHASWLAALAAKGLPLESHNQSFAAFLHHYFSDSPTPVLALKSYLPIGLAWVSLQEGTLKYLMTAWTLITAGFTFAWILSAERRTTLLWACVAMAMLILPSHLIWKSYFVMGLPLAVFVTSRYAPTQEWPVLLAVFAAVNLTGFDFIGRAWGARIESAAFLLWIQIFLIVLALVRSEPIKDRQ